MGPPEAHGPRVHCPLLSEALLVATLESDATMKSNPRCWNAWLEMEFSGWRECVSCVEVWQNSHTDWQTNVVLPIFKKGDRKQCTNYKGISLLSLPEKAYAKCLERKCQEIVESKLEDAQCGFRPSRCTRTRSSLCSKSSRNLGNVAKISLHALSILKKHMTEFLGIVWKVLHKYGVGG